MRPVLYLLKKKNPDIWLCQYKVDVFNILVRVTHVQKLRHQLRKNSSIQVDRKNIWMMLRGMLARHVGTVQKTVASLKMHSTSFLQIPSRKFEIKGYLNCFHITTVLLFTKPNNDNQTRNNFWDCISKAACTTVYWQKPAKYKNETKKIMCSHPGFASIYVSFKCHWNVTFVHLRL